MRQVLPFILCGGVGSRLWPLSREAYPKQFYRLTGPETLFQQTYRRLSGPPFGDVCVLANFRHRFLIAEQLEEIGAVTSNLVLEPTGQNTAPSACIAALIAAAQSQDALILLAPSDHLIPDREAFAAAVERGISAADRDALVVFGITPDCPHTGYGYIETQPGDNDDYLKVARFVEKPSLEVAERLLDSGSCYWNGGLFLFKAATLLKLLRIHAPEILAACQQALADATMDLGFQVLDGSYSTAPAISLDYAVAEKSANMVCVPLETPWSDVGSWSALWNILEKDARGNASCGDGEVILHNTRDSLAYSDQACITLVGVEDLVVVATQDAVLVAAKREAEQIKQIVDYLKSNGRGLTLQHNRVHRPWGWYQCLNRGDRYQVKCIMVKPGGRLSLQSHHHRSEHWVVVKGTLEVTLDEQVEILSENQSTYIPIGRRHRLANPGKVPAFLIEVQSGAYLEEDDIIRHDDVYRRSEAE
jgi:mannose-1-phosphate guanylyltransferase / mannose-6-phosphate isomerase